MNIDKNEAARTVEEARDTLRDLIDTLKEEIILEEGSWKEITKAREGLVKSLYAMAAELSLLEGPGNGQARIFKLEFGMANMFYLTEDGILYRFNDVDVTTLGTLHYHTSDGDQATYPDPEVYTVKLDAVIDGVSQVRLAEKDEPDSFTIKVDRARALLSTFKSAPEGDLVGLKVLYRNGQSPNPSFNNVYWER